MTDDDNTQETHPAITGFAGAMARFPWPDHPSLEAVEPFTWHLGGGLGLFTEILSRHPEAIVLEVCTFMGGATRTWLSKYSALRCLCVSNWDDKLVDYVRKLKATSWAIDAVGEEQLEQYAKLLEQHGAINIVQNNLAEFSERCILVPLSEQKAFTELASLDLRPDVIILHRPRKALLQSAHEYFPNAILTGGDWNWGKEEDYPVRQAAQDIADRRGGRIETRGSLFVISEPRHGAPYNEDTAEAD